MKIREMAGKARAKWTVAHEMFRATDVQLNGLPILTFPESGNCARACFTHDFNKFLN